MNLAQIVGPGGRIDYDKTVPEPRGAPHAPITVREWDGYRGRHIIVYEGCMRMEEVMRLGLRSVPLVPRGEH